MLFLLGIRRKQQPFHESHHPRNLHGPSYELLRKTPQ